MTIYGGPPPHVIGPISEAAVQDFARGLELIARHDGANDWTEATCREVAEVFAAVEAQLDHPFLEAKFNRAVAHLRCKQDEEAKGLFAQVLAAEPRFHRARVHLALLTYREDGDVERAIGEMKRAVADAEFKNEEALVHLAILQMQRGSSQGDSGCEDDLACAKLNLQRALAINDGFLPAFNQLAIFYLTTAKRQAGEAQKTSTQALELAALVCSQALRKNPGYAPVHNTSGLISAELGDLSSAARSFAQARTLDPTFFEAHMNYAAVNATFRGFAQAEEAYRVALKLHPDDVDAHLGLALAVRGRIDDTNFDRNVAEAKALLEMAKTLAPDRAEPFYNHAILVQEFEARDGSEAKLTEAKRLFEAFVAKAGADPRHAEAVVRAKERSDEIQQIIDFNRQTKDEQAKLEQERAVEEARKQLGREEAAEEAEPKP